MSELAFEVGGLNTKLESSIVAFGKSVADVFVISRLGSVESAESSVVKICASVSI